MLVICLILGVIFRAIGFLDEGSLTKANGFTFVIGAVLTNVFASLANTTPSQLVSMIGPLVLIFAVGLAICALVAILVGKLLGESWYMSFALGVTALFGFPGTLIVPTEVANAVGENEEEVEMLKTQKQEFASVHVIRNGQQILVFYFSFIKCLVRIKVWLQIQMWPGFDET